MIDKQVNEFLEELSSLSPLTGEYEATILTLGIYFNILKKNTLLTKTRINNNQLNEFLSLLDSQISNLSKYYGFSNNYINSYMQLIKMPKSTNQEINKYHHLLQELTIEKINHYLNLSTEIKKIIENYKICQNLFKDDYNATNKLCITNIENIKNYFTDISKTLCSDIENENLAFDLLSKLNRI